MENRRKGFVFYDDWYKTIKTLPDKDRLDAYDAIVNEGLCYEHRDNYSQIANVVLQMAMPQLKRDVDKYNEISVKRAEVGRLGGQANASKRKQMVANATINNNINNNIKEKEDNRISSKKENSKKESSKEKSEDEVFVDEIYREYPTKCPLNNRSTNKSYKDKERIRRLMKIYSKEDIRKVVLAEKEKVGKFYIKNFSTFLNNFPDPNSISDDNTSLQTKEKEESSYSLGADYPTSVDDVRKCDIHSYPNPWYEWMYERCPKISKGARYRYSDWDKIDENWNRFIKMCGNEKILSYACLVLERDGYEKYIKNNSFMWMVRNFLEQNNLYNGNGK